jgi:RNA polymerase sigma-70 factor (ECF subfamily)
MALVEGEPLDERLLVKRVLKGEEKAKFEFYGLYQHKLYCFCVYFMGSNDPEIEDILQEVFLTAFQKLGQFEFRSGLNTWLTQICIRKCYRYFRKRGRMVVREEEALEAGLRLRALEASDQAAFDEEQNSKKKCLEKALDMMGEPCKRLLQLRMKEDASYIEMARMLKVPMGTIMSRLARCTSSLKELVERMLEEGE